MTNMLQSDGTYSLEALLDSLLLEDWDSPDNFLRLNAGLTFSDVCEVDLLLNVRIFLAALAEEDGTAATTTGNLNRSFTGRLLDRLHIEKETLDIIRRYKRVMNERDVWDLHRVRLLSDAAGLISLHKKRFTLTRLGRSMLSDKKAGSLYHRLFIANFRRFNLGYDFPWRDVPGIQATMGVILWMLEVVAENWTPVRGLAPQILLPAVYAELQAAMVSPHDTEEWILSGLALYPLLRFGLLEQRGETENSELSYNYEVRISALWRKFISFQPPGAGQ
jgi:hypothetical protein